MAGSRGPICSLCGTALGTGDAMRSPRFCPACRPTHVGVCACCGSEHTGTAARRTGFCEFCGDVVFAAPPGLERVAAVESGRAAAVAEGRAFRQRTVRRLKWGRRRRGAGLAIVTSLLVLVAFVVGVLVALNTAAAGPVESGFEGVEELVWGLLLLPLVLLATAALMLLATKPESGGVRGLLVRVLVGLSGLLVAALAVGQVWVAAGVALALLAWLAPMGLWVIVFVRAIALLGNPDALVGD